MGFLTESHCSFKSHSLCDFLWFPVAIPFSCLFGLAERHIKGRSDLQSGSQKKSDGEKREGVDPAGRKGIIV